LNIAGRSAADGDLCLGRLRRSGSHLAGRKAGKGFVRLFLEKVLERLPRVVVAGRRWCSGAVAFLRVRRRCGVLLHGGTKFVKGAVILRVLGGDAIRHGLGALKLRAAIEKAALFATVQLERAFGALPLGVKTAGEDGAAIGAACACDGANHARGARAELIGTRAALRRLAVVAVFLVLLFRVTIAAVTVLSIHKCLLQRAEERTRRLTALGRAKARPYNFVAQRFRAT